MPNAQEVSSYRFCACTLCLPGDSRTSGGSRPRRRNVQAPAAPSEMPTVQDTGFEEPLQCESRWVLGRRRQQQQQQQQEQEEEQQQRQPLA